MMQIDISVRMERVIERFRGSRQDFLLTLLISVFLLLLITIQPMPGFLAPLRLLLGFAYVLYIPGYWLTLALFPCVDDLNSIERFGVSLGLSVAWVPVLALVLDHSPWGLSLWPILLGEYASTLTFQAVALWRRSRLPLDRVYIPVFSWRPRQWWRKLPNREKQTYQIVLGALLVAMLTLIRVFLIPSPAELMTEFYILGREGMAEDFPRQAVVDQELEVTLGVTNKERSQSTYQVEVWVEDIWKPGRRVQVARERPFNLARGENREWPVTWRMPHSGQDQEVEFLLFTGDNPEPYRRLRLFLNVEAENTTHPFPCSPIEACNTLQAGVYH